MSQTQTVKEATPGSKLAAAAQVAKNPKSRAGEKIIVASKLPMALQLQLCKSRTEVRRERATTWEETVFYKYGPIVVINGTAFPSGDVPEWMERPDMVTGAALTYGVDAEFFEQWIEQNAEHPAVKSGNIFAHTKRDHVKGMAKDNKDIDSGFGPIKHGKNADGEPIITDKRMPKKVKGQVIRAQGQREAAEAAE